MIYAIWGTKGRVHIEWGERTGCDIDLGADTFEDCEEAPMVQPDALAAMRNRGLCGHCRRWLEKQRTEISTVLAVAKEDD